MKSMMQSNPRSQPGGRPGTRRGNAMVLVAGILVLLVIIATAFITRAQTSRATAASQLAASKRTDTSQVIADSLAQIIAEHLFVRKIINNPAINPNDANLALGRFDPFTVRYERDVQIRNNLNDDYGFNYPPFQVVPYTNWPDAGAFIPSANLPSGPGNDPIVNLGAGSGSFFLSSEGNPIGNPGFGDTRWLRDLEPLRFDSNLPRNNQFNTFSHWRHLTNIAHANNAWRICRDISDIFDSDNNGLGDGNGGLVLDLNIPVEQWLADPVPWFFHRLTNGMSDFDAVVNKNLFFQQWRAWFSLDYRNSYITPGMVPANFYDLSFFGPPSDEFRFDSARNMISRILADADGDGFTDSFWFLAPNAPDSGIRQIVGMSITDNSGRLDANVATRFRRDDIRDGAGNPPALRFQQRTIGATPSDLALVGDFSYNDTGDLLGDRAAAIGNGNNEFVGFFDSIRNWERNFPNFDPLVVPIDTPASNYRETSVEYDFRMWDLLANSSDFTVPENFLGALSILNIDADANGVFDLNPSFNSRLFFQWDRLRYWRNAASRPFDAKLGLTPFGTDSELELRMFEGQNYPWIASSFENAVQNNVSSQTGFQLLHGNLAREETSEYLDQLDARELLFDARRKLTMFSSSRNDLMPPWLWWRWNARPSLADTDSSGFVEDDEFGNFLVQSRQKLDLRERDLKGRDGVAGNADDKFFDDGELSFDNRLAHTLLLALTDGSELGGDSYLGTYVPNASPDSTIQRVRKLAASYAANIKAFRDPDSRSPLANAEPLPQFGALNRDELDSINQLPNVDRLRFLGLEKQPFLVEAFIGHVYRSKAQTEFHPGLPPGNVLCDDASFRSTIVVIQIANPFDTPISLDDFQIKLFDFSNVNPAGLLGPGQRQTYYLIENDVAGDVGAGLNWLKALELTDPLGVLNAAVDPIDLLANPGLFVDVTAGVITPLAPPWPVERDLYDTVALAQRNIELVRIDNSLGESVEVVVDRFDMPTLTNSSERFAFGKSVVTELANNRPAVGSSCIEPMGPPPLPWPGVVPALLENVVYASRVTRAWDLTDALPANNLKSPRYIFHDRKIVDSYWGGLDYNNSDNPLTWFSDDNNRPRFGHRNKRFFGETGRDFTFSLQMLQKDANFDQVGELLNVWLFSHELRFTDNGALFFIPDTGDTVTGIATTGLNLNGDPDGGTIRTFSEYLALDNTNLVGDDIRVNRLQIKPETVGGNTLSPVIGIGITSGPFVLRDLLHTVPDLPAGARVLDAFVCDDFGLYMDIDLNGDFAVNIGDRIFQENNLVYGNAIGFTGRGTPGLININTAPVEVMRAMPQMDALVHSDPTGIVPYTAEPYVAVPQAIVHYRERFSGLSRDSPLLNVTKTGFPGGANYRIREPNVRDERGISSIGELMLLEEEAAFLNYPPIPVPIQDWARVQSWRMDFASQDPYQLSGFPVSNTGAFISTDVQGDTSTASDPTRLSGDGVSDDVEEANLLFAGISNLITTRSDMFTVHFIVRSFRQNPITGIWDATDREQIVDERRYVMLVDRSEVNRPTDRPRILYLEKLPN